MRYSSIWTANSCRTADEEKYGEGGKMYERALGEGRGGLETNVTAITSSIVL